MSEFPLLIYHPRKSSEVYEKSLRFFRSNPRLEDRVENLLMSYFSIGKAIPHTTENLFSGHFFPYTESYEELQIAFNLALFGFYKQAFVALRGAIEVGMLSVYYNINDDGHNAVKSWLSSKDSWEANTPNTRKIWSILLTNENISSFDKKFELKTRYENLGFLHNYAHTKGIKYSNQLGKHKSNWQTFEEDVLLKWIAAFQEVVIILITLHMLKYPISIIKYDWGRKVGIDNPFPVLDEYEVERIEELLPDDYFDEIVLLAAQDQHTQELFEQIKNIDDMTEEEAEAQLLDFYKFEIENGIGFMEWEKKMLKRVEFLDEEQDKQMRNRIELLRAWADDNQLMKPKTERLKQHNG